MARSLRGQYRPGRKAARPRGPWYRPATLVVAEGGSIQPTLPGRGFATATNVAPLPIAGVRRVGSRPLSLTAQGPPFPGASGPLAPSQLRNGALPGGPSSLGLSAGLFRPLRAQWALGPERPAAQARAIPDSPQLQSYHTASRPRQAGPTAPALTRCGGSGACGASGPLAPSVGWFPQSGNRGGSRTGGLRRAYGPPFGA